MFKVKQLCRILHLCGILLDKRLTLCLGVFSLFALILAGRYLQHRPYILYYSLWSDAVLLVIFHLNLTAAVGFGHCLFHTVRNRIGIHYDLAFGVSCRPAYSLYKRGFAS